MEREKTGLGHGSGTWLHGHELDGKEDVIPEPVHDACAGKAAMNPTIKAHVIPSPFDSLRSLRAGSREGSGRAGGAKKFLEAEDAAKLPF